VIKVFPFDLWLVHPKLPDNRFDAAGFIDQVIGERLKISNRSSSKSFGSSVASVAVGKSWPNSFGHIKAIGDHRIHSTHLSLSAV